MALAEFGVRLFTAVDYETALKTTEENFRLRSLIIKVLVVKHERKVYLLKDAKTIKTFVVSLGRNLVGQKEHEDDGKTTEGIYTLDWQKWNGSTLHSFHISYPKLIWIEQNQKLTPESYIMAHDTSKGIKKEKRLD